ncbi:hypothetical protein B0T10DRAFT_558455 [Thelonectria olida]|uniref:Zn(2)-C6 fungal-type domain-containing protein n=1 Tax=Thelonectria olida TaxID=1576542 RepID=A0A9P8WAM4_9HYPO|nr:hypothetical protein B0T10DRAFT_558455 [Thelonectria olida]
MSHRSRGCLRCRQRRVKCDRRRPSCQRCLTRNELCVGYRDEVDLLFQNETEKVVLKSTSKSATSSSSSSTSSRNRSSGRRTRSRSVEPSPVTEPLDTSAVQVPSSHRPWLKKSHAGHQSASLEDQAVSIFMDAYVIHPCNESSSPGFLEHLPCLFGEVNVQGRYALRWAVQAAAFANLSREEDAETMAHRALECYGEALGALGKSLAEKRKAPDDYDLMAVVMLDIFETLFLSQSSSTTASHTQGMAHILRLRGHEQFYDARGWGLFRLAHHRLVSIDVILIQDTPSNPSNSASLPSKQKQQLAKQMPPLPESKLWLENLNDNMSSVRLEKDALEISTICHRANEVLQSLNSGAIDFAELIQLVLEMIRLDQETAHWRNGPEWAFRSITKSHVIGNKEGINKLPDTIQLHRDLWMAYEWNYHRTARIILHQRLLACLDKASSMPNAREHIEAEATMRDLEFSSLFQIELLADEVLSTVPQCLGDVDHLGQCLCDSSSPPRHQAVGAYLLLWPIKIIKSTDGKCTASQKAAASAVFERIRECTGMKTNLGALSLI